MGTLVPLGCENMDWIDLSRIHCRCRLFCKHAFIWRVSSSGILRWVAPDVSEERIASIFRAEELVQQTSHLLARWFAELILRPWRWRQYVPPKRRVQLNGPHCGISQKMILFITTDVKTSNPTHLFLLILLLLHVLLSASFLFLDRQISSIFLQSLLLISSQLFPYISVPNSA
jgi:hypothetical protein